MKKLLFICGPNGIGKTSVCREIIRSISGSAYVDSDACRVMNPFVLNDETIPTIARNISDLIFNYMECPLVDTVVFSYGFHGRRREVFNMVIQLLSNIDYEFVPVLLWCSVKEQLCRLRADNRSDDRILTAIKDSRNAFADADYPKVDITDYSVEEAAHMIIENFL